MTPVLGFTVTYAISNVLLAVWGTGSSSRIYQMNNKTNKKLMTKKSTTPRAHQKALRSSSSSV